jgi:hypothetical protein
MYIYICIYICIYMCIYIYDIMVLNIKNKKILLGKERVMTSSPRGYILSCHKGIDAYVS